ncbi:hypothetical protein NGM10_04750 [Halorussus salilacus]|uniref:hypothetical protein n=1 Tax=Halorussus salilacus TaxID=2953750 RepID=UPI00209EE983|nr:hypothetical protein [Halorussus salilacus]USZ69048.1 hypothetical protein NGM10_04750 [Halorussus salilacus]
MAVYDTSTTSDEREAYRKYEDGEITEEEARQVIGDDWEATVTGVLMEESLEGTDWDEAYEDDPIF